MADAKQKWIDATQQILSKLDIAAEYASFGVEVSGKQPGAKGWLPCHAIGRADKNASASINVGDGPLRGRYKDFGGGVGGGKTVGLFDFAAGLGKCGGNWKEVRNYYARQTGVKLPDGEEGLPSDRLELFDLTFGVTKLYCDGKPGVTPAAIRAVGGRGARWPKGLPAEKTNHLIAFPMHGSALLDADPVGWHVIAQNPKGKIRKFQGQGHDEALLKTMTLGEYGLMGVDGLGRLESAEVVNITEGISDLLAAQAVLPEGIPHAVISAGGASYHPKAEWMQHFAGKEVRIWFDVGDADKAGEIGAAVWVAALLPVAKCVRDVKLPLGVDGGKNDLRAWLTSSRRTYEEMSAYAETFEPIVQEDAEAQLSPYEAILKTLGLHVIGEHENSQKIEVFSERLKKSATIHDVNWLTIPTLIQICGAEVVDAHIHDGKEVPPGMSTIKDVKKAVADAASGKVYIGGSKLGAGVWEVNRQVVLVKTREAALVGDDGVLERTSLPFLGGRQLDLSAATGDWFDIGTLGRYLAEAQKREWCWNVVDEATTLFGNWYWRYRPANQIVTMLALCSWVQSLFYWRPQVMITGNSDTGKTVLMEEVLASGIFGAKASLYVQKPTEAAIRQHMRHHGKIILIDEFESDAHRQKVYELFRTSSHGGKVIRGTTDQKGSEYGLKHIPWVACIESGLHKQADRNRYIILDLEMIPPEKRGRLKLPGREQLRDLGVRMLAVALANQSEARRWAGVLKGEQADGVPGRVVESFSVPCGMYAAIFGASHVGAVDWMRRVLGDWDFGGQVTRDEVDLLQEVYTTEVVLERGDRLTVGQLLKRLGKDLGAADSLARAGIRRVVRRKKKDANLNPVPHIFFCHDAIRKGLLRTTSEFRGQRIDQFLMRIPGAERDQQRLGGDERFCGVSVPEDAIRAMFRSDAVDEDELLPIDPEQADSF